MNSTLATTYYIARPRMRRRYYVFTPVRLRPRENCHQATGHSVYRRIFKFGMQLYGVVDQTPISFSPDPIQDGRPAAILDVKITLFDICGEKFP